MPSAEFKTAIPKIDGPYVFSFYEQYKIALVSVLSFLQDFNPFVCLEWAHLKNIREYEVGKEWFK
jgi:hypothetical protein